MRHEPTRRALGRGAVALTTLAVGWSAAGCSGAPRNASAEDFCRAYFSVADTTTAGGAGADLPAWGARLQEVGTPAEIDDAARAGFEAVAEAARNHDTDAGLSSLDIAESDEDDVAALSEFVAQECRSEIDNQREASGFDDAAPQD